MERIAALSAGTKLMLASGVLLFVDLFFTWQNVPQRYGTKFAVTVSLDGWDRLGLVLALLTLGLLGVVVARAAEVELSPEVPWNHITLALAAAVLAVAALKNVTDAHSAWAAYAGVALAAGLVVGALLDRDRPAPEPRAVATGKWKPRARAGAASTTGSQPSAEPRQREPRRAEPARRW